MDQTGPSSRNIIPETPVSPTGSDSSDVVTNNNVPRVGILIPLGFGLESSSEDEYEEPSSEEEDVNNNVDDDNGPVNQAAPIDYGFDDDYNGDGFGMRIWILNLRLVFGSKVVGEIAVTQTRTMSVA